MITSCLTESSREQQEQELARLAMDAQAEAIAIAARRLDAELSRALGLILGHAGKVAVTGDGEAERLARRLAVSLSETGTPAAFLEPGDATSVDLSAYTQGDPVLIVSEAGKAAELLNLVTALHGFGSPLIAILGNRASPLATEVDVVLDASVTLEFSLHGLRSGIALAVLAALGDALVFTVLRSRRLPLDDLARLFPPGQHEANLRLTVAEVMHRGQAIARVQRDDTVRDVAFAITRHPLGAACVTSRDGRLEGLITEHDLSRVLQAKEDIWFLRAEDIMTASPVTITPHTPLHEALRLLESATPPMSALAVVDPADGRCLGLVRLLDICQAGLA